jgi:hypothetical protein
MNIHVCGRCEGCGHVTGGFQWEVPWTRWAPTPEAAKESFLDPQACPDCGGTGALIELGEGTRMPAFPIRRGIRHVTSYADHVAMVLRIQGKKST